MKHICPNRKKELCVLNSSTQTIKRRTSSPSLSMVHGLNPSVRPLVLVQSLESLVWCVLHLVILCYFVCGTHITLLAICIAWSYWLLIALSTFVVFKLLLLINLSLILCQKSKNHIKSRKSKSLIDIVEFCLKTCFALYLCANGFVHLRA